MDPATMQDITNTVRRTVRQMVSQLEPSAEVTSSGTRVRKVKVSQRLSVPVLSQGKSASADFSSVTWLRPANFGEVPITYYGFA